MISGQVYLGGAACGNAPQTLPAVQVQALLHRGDVFVDEMCCCGQAAGIHYESAGAVTFTRPGNYRVRSMLLHREAEVAVGRTTVHRGAHGGGDTTLRNAQFMCGVFGLIIINLILLFDTSSRLSNIKDFAINYASDMLAVGSILLLSELYQPARTGPNNMDLD